MKLCHCGSFSTVCPAFRPPGVSGFASREAFCIPARWATDPGHECVLRAALCPRKRKLSQARSRSPLTVRVQTPDSTDLDF